MADLCVCETDEAVPECRARAPSMEDAEMLGEILPWRYCTRGVGHEGDHLFCGGNGPHAVERWPQVAPKGDR